MKSFIAKNEKQGNKKAFEIIKDLILLKPDSLIGLAVGKTTDGLYKILSSDVKKRPKIWSRIKIFQIDENLGIPPKSSLSFNYEIKKELKELLKVIDKKNVFLMDGGKNPKNTISSANKFIKKNNGIDLIILGIGPEYDPHIAYNTCGKSGLSSRLRVVELHKKVIEKLREKSKVDLGSIKGITLGIKDVLDAKKALLIAYGKDKALSMQISFQRKINLKRSTASALQLHKDLFVIADKEAGAGLHR